MRRGGFSFFKKWRYSQEMYHKCNSIILEAHINVASDPRIVDVLPWSNEATEWWGFFPPQSWRVHSQFSPAGRLTFAQLITHDWWGCTCIYIFIYLFISGCCSGHIFSIMRIQAENEHHSITVKKKKVAHKNNCMLTQETSKQPQTTSYWIRLLLLCCCWLLTPLDFYQKLIQSEQTAFKFHAEKNKKMRKCFVFVITYYIHCLFFPPQSWA